MITFEQARRAAVQAVAPLWHPNLGSLTTLATGFEDDTTWRVMVGSRESLGGDLEKQVLDFPAVLVDKTTGKVDLLPVIAIFERLDAMRPYGRAQGR